MLSSRLLDSMLEGMNEPEKMQCDIYEKENAFFIEMDLPGCKKEDIQIECQKGNLTISAIRKETETENKKYLRRERKVYGRYERSFYLGEIADENIEAELIDGTLKICIPKREETEIKKSIPIK